MTIEDIRKLNREYKNEKVKEKSINIEKQGKLLRGTLQNLTALIEKGGFRDGTILKDIQEWKGGAESKRNGTVEKTTWSRL